MKVPNIRLLVSCLMLGICLFVHFAAKAAWLNKCAGGEAEPINGTLKFYGASTIEAFKNLGSAPVETTNLADGDFSKSNTATAIFPKGENKFFKAKIE